MKKIKIVDKITLKNLPKPGGGTGEVDYTMKEWIGELLDNYSGFGKGVKGIRQAIKIEKAFADADNDFTIDDAEWNALKKAMEDVTLNPKVARQIIAFYDAIEGATDPNNGE